MKALLRIKFSWPSRMEGVSEMSRSSVGMKAWPAKLATRHQAPASLCAECWAGWCPWRADHKVTPALCADGAKMTAKAERELACLPPLPLLAHRAIYFSLLKENQCDHVQPSSKCLVLSVTCTLWHPWTVFTVTQALHSNAASSCAVPGSCHVC